MPHMKAERILAENVAALLKKHGATQRDLAQWCRHSDVWVSQFLRGERSWQLEDLDRVADFLHLDTHELFRPGVVAQTDRRIAQRRVNPERRVGYAVRMAHELASQLDPARRKESGRGDQAQTLTQAAQLQNLIADFTRRVATFIPPSKPRRQTASARRAGTKVSKRAGKGRRPDVEKSGS